MTPHAFIGDATRTPFGRYGTAGNASGVNDGSCAPLLADEKSAAQHGLTPKARVVGMATVVNQLVRSAGRYAQCTMWIGVGQGIALVLERV